MGDAPSAFARSRRNPSERKRSNRGYSIGLSAASTIDVVRQIERGLPYAAVTRFAQASGFPIGKIAELVHIPIRTLMRRKAAGRLDPNESERLLRIASTFERALDLFEGDRAAALRWLSTPRAELANHPPIELARTEVGAREVEDLIGRLDQGVFT